MAMFACWSTFLVRKKKKSKGFPNVADGSDKGSSNGDLRVKPIDLVSPSADEAYEGGDEHDGNRSMKKKNSDLELQPKGELASHLSNPNLTSYVFEKASEALIASGHVSDPGIERTAFLESPVLKRSCSNIETKRAKQWIKSPKRSSSYSNLENLPGNGGFQIRCENHSSPLSLRSSCSADRVMLKRRSSSQVLPSRSRKIWWKLFLWSHRNLHKPTDSRRQISVLRASKQKEGYSSDTHEPGQKLDEDNRKMMESANQWVAFSLGFSHMDRVNAWVNSLEDCDGIEDEQTGNLDRMEIEESSEKVCSHISHRAAEDEAQANSIIQSLNAFSSVAHISGIGLKAIPSISAFVCLRSVNLSGNSIVHIASGSLPKSLHTLDLSRNRISTVEGLRDLERLRVLNLSYNRITRIGHGLSSCTVIRELYLAGNKISNVEGLHRLLKLTVLDLSFNKLTTAKALGQLVANYNSLLALNLLGNPIQTNIGDDQLKKAVLSLLPHVTYLNKQLIKPHRVREVVTKSVAKAALGDVGRTSRRKLTRRLSQGLGSAAISRVGEGSFRAIKHGKSRHSTSGRR